jgi:hypothetical protein
MTRITSRISEEGTGTTHGMPSTDVNSNAAARTLIFTFLGRLKDKRGDSVCKGVFGGEWESARTKAKFTSSEPPTEVDLRR